jgi:hypothetical protein
MKEDIIRMAREAAENNAWKPGLGDEFVVAYFERFAALVAAAEREACAKALHTVGLSEHISKIAAAIRARGGS